MPIDNSRKHANFIARCVAVSQEYKDIYDRMQALTVEWNAMGYSPGNATPIVDADCLVTSNLSGHSHPYLNAAMVTAFIVSCGNLVSYWNAGNGTNISQMIP